VTEQLDAVLRIRIFWGISSQAVSSIGNFALSIALVHTLSPDGFGAYAVTAIVYAGLLQVVRVLTAAPLFLFRSEDSFVQAARSRTILTATTAIGLGAGLIMIAIVAPFSLPGRGVTIVVALGMPILLAHETARQEFLGRGLPRLATLLDSLWTGTFLMGLFVAAVSGLALSAEAVTVLWASAACVALLIMYRRLQARGARRDPRVRILDPHKSFTRQLGLEYLGNYLGTQGLQLLLPIAGGFAVAGAYRAAAQNVLGIAAVASNGVIPQITYEYRRRASSPSALRRLSWEAATVVCVALLIVGVVGFLLPERLGEAVAGSLWSSAKPLILPVAIVLVGNTWTTLRLVPLRFGVSPRSLRRVRWWLTIPSVALPLLGVGGWDLTGLAWGCVAAGIATIGGAELAVRRLWLSYVFGSVGRSDPAWGGARG
jgi:hypothetical protein